MFQGDHPLLVAFRAGEPHTLRAVYDRYVDLVAHVVRQGAFSRYGKRLYGAPRSDWKDLVNDVFVRAFADETRMSFDGLGDYQPFLLGICRNVLANYWRKRAQAPDQETLARALALETPADEHDLADPEALRMTLEYVQALSPELRAVYEARYVQARSQLEAAEQLGLTRQALRTREQRLRQGLVKRIKNRLGMMLKKESTQVNSGAKGSGDGEGVGHDD